MIPGVDGPITAGGFQFQPDEEVNPVNGGGLADIPTALPDGRGIPRGDGHDWYPGFGGARYRQPQGQQAPTLREKELEEKKLAKVRTFDMEKVEDVNDYQKVMTDIANGHAALGSTHEAYCETTGNWKVWVRWYERVLEKKKKPEES